MGATPILDATERLFDGKAQYIRKFMSTPNVDDPFWAPCKHRAALDLVNIPILLRTGWYDTLTSQTIGAYKCLRDRGKTVYLTIGPWTHVEASGQEALPEAFEFLDEHVAGRKKDYYRPLPVKVFTTGAEEWRPLPSWPPLTEERIFYLHGDGVIDKQRPAADSPSASFTFNPADPTPTMGGPLLARGGRVDDSAYSSRSDLLIYTSAPLTEELEIMGMPIVELTHSTDIPYADLWVRLSEVNPEGVSYNLNENWQALDGLERPDGKISISLTDRAHVFKKETRIRVIVAGGSFPLIARNAGTGVNRTQAAELRPVTHTVRHRDGISKLILPCSR
jgi:putative CocE/NonD family hydrolase